MGGWGVVVGVRLTVMKLLVGVRRVVCCLGPAVGSVSAMRLTLCTYACSVKIVPVLLVARQRARDTALYHAAAG